MLPLSPSPVNIIIEVNISSINLCSTYRIQNYFNHFRCKFFLFLTVTKNWLFDTTTKLNFNQYENIGIILKFYFQYFHQKYFTSKCNQKQRHNLNDDFYKHPRFYLLWRLPKKICVHQKKNNWLACFFGHSSFCFHFPQFSFYFWLIKSFICWMLIT